ncbi:MAG TPA: hypothetical protein DIW31_01745 [Bacteroidales bacterium]|nr:hypothetical protein [Bacteroidales bacterium]
MFQGVGYSQTPQGFTYQAVIRSETGTPIGNRNIGIKITLESEAQFEYYSETHTSQTNEQGVFTVIVGTGTKTSTGLFSNIPWSNGDVRLKIGVDINGGTSYTILGQPTILQAVPYALYAENSKEVVSNPNDIDADPIFVVKNKLGQIVFAVYQSGVRAYVSDTTATKGAKGGFAVGGLTSKSISDTQDYFSITPSSARIWLNDAAKGAKGGFAVGGLTSKGKSSTGTYLHINPENYFIGHESGNAISTGIYNSVFGYYAGSALNTGSRNTFIGNRVGEKTTLGSSNVFIGNFSGNANESGSRNIFIGDSAGVLNGGSGSIIIGSSAGRKSTNTWNAVFVGNGAGYNDLSGMPNTFIGNNSGFSNTLGGQNTFIGNFCGYKNTEGTSNVFIGNYAAYSNVDGQQNVVIGENAGYNGTTGGGNVFIGYNVAYSKTTSHGNTFVGNYSGYQNTTGNGNTFIGNGSGSATDIGEENVFVGYGAGGSNKDGSYNTFVGRASGLAFLNGNNNTYLGCGSGYYKTSGNNNVFIGLLAGAQNNTGSGNVFIGKSAGFNQKGSNQLIVSNSDADSTLALVYGEFDTKMLAFNANVGIGTIQPDKKLHVVGDARITGDIYYGTGTSVYQKPDFVFTSDYSKYKEPSEVEIFINKNGHLPWFTAANEEKGGINLTRMQFETVETVENLQLQIIELNTKYQEQIKNQQSEIENLKVEIENLKLLVLKK